MNERLIFILQQNSAPRVEIFYPRFIDFSFVRL